MFRLAPGGRWGQVVGFGGEGFLHGFSTRRGGVSEGPYESLNVGMHSGDDPSRVVTNRSLLFADMGWALEAAVFLRQVHGVRVVRVDASHRGAGAFSPLGVAANADGMITDEPGMALAVLCADCAPVYLFDPGRPAVGLLHAGWRGTVGGIVGKALEAMEGSFGSEPGRLLAAIGPAIGPCCYPVGGDVAEQFAAAGLSSALRAPDEETGQWRVDLGAALRQQLLDAGLSPDNISSADVCTSCQEQLFFSHRRMEGTAGRMAAVIGLTGGS